MEKNKKIIIIVGILLLALIITIISLVLIKPEKKEVKKEVEEVKEIKEEKIDNTEYFNEKNLLVEKITTNEKDYSTTGTFILTDGSIYTYKIDQTSNETGDSLERMIENSTKLDETVSEEDLILIKKNISNLKDEVENIDGDQSVDSMTMINVYNANGPVLIKSSGVQASENKTDEGNSLLNIINKYIK